ncbi:hypothetical protein IFM89_031914 [Coptis chinensis]|uniref:Uncharacterized protein n=1 Tax=Coptis chinensis TaxID=261450 RepID=A0A835M7U9_9MAGN|nr:hypothetical protein IFM89_031914 [Coptis chinensis]
MACLDMFNNEHQNGRLAPRISFSNDFADTQQQIINHEKRTPTTSTSSDFEFSVSNYNMMAADELFSKGRLLPFKDNCTNQFQPKMTLREELLHDEEEDRMASSSSSSGKPPKGPSRWKELLGLKRNNHIVSKKADKRSMVHEEEAHTSKSSQAFRQSVSLEQFKAG